MHSRIARWTSPSRVPPMVDGRIARLVDAVRLPTAGRWLRTSTDRNLAHGDLLPSGGRRGPRSGAPRDPRRPPAQRLYAGPALANGSMPRWPPPAYRFQVDFDAPLAFVYRWCTDYREDDGRRSGEPYQRWILSRSRRRVVFEDLWRRRDGWGWRHTEVRLQPPDRWHADSMGSVREAALDYQLRALPGDRTRLTLRMRRRPTMAHPDQLSREEMQLDLAQMWTGFSRALGQDYLAQRRGGSGRTKKNG